MEVVIVILVLGALAVLIFKKFTKFIYYISMVDILLRIIAFISEAVSGIIPELTKLLSTYIPTSVSSIICMYTDGIFETVLLWLLVANYIVFEYHLIKLFFKSK